MMFRGAYHSDFYRRVRDLLHEQVTLQQSSGTTQPQHYQAAHLALDARWDALIASEHAHRTEDGTPSVVESHHVQPLRHASTAQNR
jgi:anaerobic magnesium-protoporphyrin IX monomethyl ester cyclase